MIQERCDWVEFRQRFRLLPEDEIDLHFGRRDYHFLFEDAMATVEDIVVDALREAFERHRPYIMFVHGWSTSRPGQTTARSVVRRVMQSKRGTPFIDRTGCIRHKTVFVAKLRNQVRP
jgi:hypothetical protein